MEKITLKPQIKELVFRGEKTDTHFDAAFYAGATTQEKALGSLMIVGQIKFSDEDLSYLTSLIFSLAKREYYSERSVESQDSKTAFNGTLKKLNEVLEEFFQNKNFKLNIGLVVISGDNVFISRLGKFKISLARNNKLIDILNNVELFSKESEGEKQFSNIISGKLRTSDKLFAYYPFRSITSRERQLNGLLMDMGQEDFSQKLSQLASNAKNFSCCGFHVHMQEIKEIPVHSKPSYGTPIVASMESNDKKGTSDKNEAPEIKPLALNKEGEDSARSESELSGPDKTRTEPELNVGNKTSYIIPAELSISRRTHIFSRLFNHVSRIKNLERLSPRTRTRTFLVIAAIVILPLLAITGFRALGTPSEIKGALEKSTAALQTAQSYIEQNNSKEARELLGQALAAISEIRENKKADELENKIIQNLAAINKTGEQKPASVASLEQYAGESSLSVISAFKNQPFAASNDGRLFAIIEDDAREITNIGFPPKYLFDTESAVAAYNGSDLFWSFDLRESNAYSPKEAIAVDDATIYENNLYVLSGNSVYKYADAVTGGTNKTLWGSNLAGDGLISIAVDGNVYVLSSSGKLSAYFKGEKTGEFDLQLIPALDSRVFTFKDHSFIYLADKINARVYVFDKATGELKVSYDLSSVGSVNSVSVSQDGTIWILSGDNKVWQIR